MEIHKGYFILNNHEYEVESSLVHEKIRTRTDYLNIMLVPLM